MGLPCTERLTTFITFRTVVGPDAGMAPSLMNMDLLSRRAATYSAKSPRWKPAGSCVAIS